MGPKLGDDFLKIILSLGYKKCSCYRFSFRLHNRGPGSIPRQSM